MEASFISPLSIGEDFISSPDHKTAGISEIDFGGSLQPPLRIYENVADGCGGQTWPAGMVLSKYLLREKQLASLRGKSMFVRRTTRVSRLSDGLINLCRLELGAGSGLVGIAIALGLSRNKDDASVDAVPGYTVQLTDQAPMLPIMQRNIALNDLTDATVTADILDWGSQIREQSRRPDVILAAECVYFEPAFPLLLQTLEALIVDRTLCYFCFKKRRRADLRFMKDARKLFKVEDVLDDPDRETWSRENLFM